VRRGGRGLVALCLRTGRGIDVPYEGVSALYGPDASPKRRRRDESL
jgi:hypothetical protein